MFFLGEIDSQFDTILYVSIAVGGAIILFILFYILYKFIFYPRSLRKKVRELDRKFEYLHALLNGQDIQYVKRLEIISRSNLLYSEIHAQYLKRYKEVRNRYDSVAQNSINKLKDLLMEKKYKNLKDAFNEAKEVMTAFEKSVNQFNDDLMVVIKPEEDAKQAITVLKEKYRKIKIEFHDKEDEIELVVTSFNTIFEHIDSMFVDFDGLVESAHYEETNSMLPNIDKALNELSRALEVIPNLCALLTDIIPDKLHQLKRAYNEMLDNNYPVHHLIIKGSLEDMNNEIAAISKKVRNFDFEGTQNTLNVIIKNIDECFVLFDKEKDAKVIFDKECSQTYLAVSTLEKRFIRLCNTIPDIKKVFVIDDVYFAKIDGIQKNVNTLGGVKRTLDTFIHSATKQPYSILVDKMKELQNQTKSIDSQLNEYQFYLDSLKTNSESAYALLSTYYLRAKKVEKIIRDVSLQVFADKYSESIDKIYELIDSLYKTLNTLPINVSQVTSIVNELNNFGEKTMYDIEQDYNMMQMADAAILFANRDRQHLNNIDQLVTQSERQYFNAEFENAYVQTGNALKLIRQTGVEAKQ